MKIENSAVFGEKIKLVTPPTIYEDFRQHYIETWNKELYAPLGIDFMTDDISVSRKNVLVGIHGDFRTWKLVSCLHGSFYLIILCNQPDSPFYRQWESYTLSDVNRLQVLIPPGYGNGHLVLTDIAIFHYKQSEYYDREGQFTIKWDDPTLDIYWPIKNPILSRRDA